MELRNKKEDLTGVILLTGFDDFRMVDSKFRC